MRPALLLACAVQLVSAACDETPLCTPETPMSCYCSSGDVGQKICTADGLGFGPCNCLPDAGVDAAAVSSPVELKEPPEP